MGASTTAPITYRARTAIKKRAHDQGCRATTGLTDAIAPSRSPTSGIPANREAALTGFVGACYLWSVGRNGEPAKMKSHSVRCARSTTRILTGLDLFAGAGGLTLGLKTAGIRTTYAVEFEPHRVATFRTHTPDAEVAARDIRALDFSPLRGKIDVVYGGPPCQPFSSGGLREGPADDRDMVPHFVAAVRDVRPVAFLMENVPGLTSPAHAEYLRQTMANLDSLGYVVVAKVLNAADFGVPQKRRRLFVVGMRDAIFRFPRETHGPGRRHPHVAVGDVLPQTPVGEPNPSRVFYARNPDLRPSPFDGHLFNGGGRPIDRTAPCHTILASAGGNKTPFFDDGDVVAAYHRHLLEGGKPFSGPVPGARRLTVLESQIIQTFPSGMEFSGPRSAQYHQVGDAVPPRLAAVVGRALACQVSGHDREGLQELHSPQPHQETLCR